MQTQMELSRRRFLSLASMSAAGVLLAACQPTATPAVGGTPEAAATESPTAPPKVEEQVVFTYLVREYETEGEWKDVVKSWGERFSQKYPNAKAEQVFIPGAQYFDKLQTMIAAGNPPDIFNVDPTSFFLTWIKNGTILDLQANYEKDKDFFKDWPEFFIKGATWNGKLYGISIDGGAIYNLWSNFGWFKEAGVEPPVEEGWDVDQFLSTCQTLSKPEEKLFAYHPFTCVWHWWPMAFGGGIIDPDDPTRCILDKPESQEALQFIVDLRWKHNVSPQPAQEVEGQAGRQGYVAKRIAMVHAGAWFLPSLEGSGIEAGVLYPPKGRAGQIIMATIQMWVTYSGAKNPDMCWEFNKLRIDEESCRKQIEVVKGTSPNRKMNEEVWLPLMKQLADEGKGYQNYESFITGYDHAKLWAQMPQEAWDVLHQELDPVWLNQKTVAEYVATTVPKVNKILQEWWSE
ncbi:MAG: ABC transporter substrate-binding protein [Anaerolineae bacterium]